MAITVGQDTEAGEEAVIGAINTTPLVDVMLVLLIIFLITIPVVTQNIPVQLPKETNQARQTKPENIEISINKDGDIFWNLQLISDTTELVDKLKKEAVRVPQPAVQIRGDAATRYQAVGRVVFACQRAGMIKIGFITEPPARG
jgi:biopolymer transport protein ExbD